MRRSEAAGGQSAEAPSPVVAVEQRNNMRLKQKQKNRTEVSECAPFVQLYTETRPKAHFGHLPSPPRLPRMKLRS